MAVHYYYGEFPAGFDYWKKGLKDKPLIDPDDGIVAMYFEGRYRIRNTIGRWVTLGNNHYAPRDRSYFVELQSSNKDWRSDWYLDKVFDGQMPPAEQEFVILPADEKYRQVEALARRQQSQWAKAVKARAGGRCHVTGSALALEAAHIKPFCLCSTQEAVSLTNGVCLTASVHTLFDSIASVNDIPKNDPLYRLLDLKKLGQLIAQRDKMNG
ncbi:hypothetical protein HO291_003491 [Salmonella enterica]|nr:hypothetical protein [Salmonella enterica]